MPITTANLLVRRLRMPLVLACCAGAVACATPEPKSPVDQLLADVDAEQDASYSTSEDLARLRWKAASLRADPKSGYAARELALTDTWIASATALSVMSDRDEARYTLLLDAVSTTLGSIQALYARLDAEATLENARVSFVNDSVAPPTSSAEGSQP